jgi:hypothetical protein
MMLAHLTTELHFHPEIWIPLIVGGITYIVYLARG